MRDATSKDENSEKVFKEGDHVYFYLTDNEKIAVYDGLIQDKDDVYDSYRIAVKGDENGCYCMYFVPAGNVFFTKEELYYECEGYCSELASYWKNKADEFYELWLHGDNEEK